MTRNARFLAPLFLMLLVGCMPPDPASLPDVQQCDDPADVTCPDSTSECSGCTADCQVAECSTPDIEPQECMAGDVQCQECVEPTECEGEPNCPNIGVCEGVDFARCSDGQWVCNFDDVPQFELGGERSCDGLDNDCDGLTDENVDVALAPCLTVGLCAEFAPACLGGEWVCSYTDSENFQADGETSCDGLDNNCDGNTDEELCQVCTPPEARCGESGVQECALDGNSYDETTCSEGTVCMGPGVCTVDGEFVVSQDEMGNRSGPVAAHRKEIIDLAWVAEGFDGSSDAVVGRQLSENATPIGQEILLNEFTLGSQYAPFFGGNEDNLLVGWTSQNQDGDGSGLFGLELGTDGTFGPEYQLTPSALQDQYSGALFSLDEGYLLVWSQKETSWGNLAGARLTPEGWPLPFTGLLSTVDEENDSQVGGIVLDEDTVLLVWQRSTAVSGTIQMAQIDVQSWTPEAAPSILVGPESGEFCQSPSVVRVGEQIFVAWVELVSSRWCLQRHDLALAPVGSRLCQDIGASSNIWVKLNVLSGDRVLVSWQGGSMLEGEIRSQALGMDGALVGMERLVAEGQLNPDSPPDILVLAGDRVATFWSEQTASSLYRIMGRIYQWDAEIAQ